jgi:PAS domain S-box-containing protein
MADGLHAAAAFPIRLANDVFGVIESFSTEVLEPDQDLLDLLSAVGNHISHFILRGETEDRLRHSEAVKSAIVQSAIDCVISIDHEGRVIEWNPAAEETFGYPRAEVIGKEMAELIIPPRLREKHRQGITRYLETGEGPLLNKRVEITGQRANGEEIPVELAVVPVSLEGAPIFTGYLRDITESKRAERERGELLERERTARTEAESAGKRLWQLQHITEAALSHLSLEELFDELLMRIAEVLNVEIAAILLASDDGDYLTVRATLGLTARGSRRRLRLGRGLVGRVAASGRPEFVENPRRIHLAIPELRHKKTHSLGAVPLMVERRVTGVVLVGSTKPRTFSRDDELLLQLAADRIAIAIENARLYEREHGIAAALQRSLLLHRLPDIPNVGLAARYFPGGAGVDVGGDWYDVIPLPQGRVGLGIGDVAGRGIRAATIMGQLRNAVRAYAFEGVAPGTVLSRVNRLVNSLERTGMVTAVYLIFDPETGDMTYSCAGHPPPLLRRAEGTVEYLNEGRSLPLGVLENSDYYEGHVALEPGDALMLYTDGLIEKHGEGIDEGMARLRSAVADAPEDLEELCEHVVLRIFEGGEISDDVAFVLIRNLSRVEPLRIRAPAKAPSAVVLRRAMREWLQGVGSSEDDIFDITVACGEAVSNSIEHAYDLGDGDVELVAEAANGSVVVSVYDFGRWRSPRAGDRGRGFQLMRALMDDVEVLPSAEGSQVRLTRRLNLPA